ncbi:MAG: PqqD family peptide modification chaperone [Terrisporobacter sp.]
MKTNNDILNLKFKICDDLKFIIDESGKVTVLEKQDHKIQKILRILRFRIPMYKEIELDEFCSTVFTSLDGEKTVEEIGHDLDIKYGEKVYPLYERLLLFLNHISINCNYIEKID